MFRTVSQTLINYRGDTYQRRQGRPVHGGDRLPWVAGSDNYKSLARMIWQLHVYGTPCPGIDHWCESNQVPLTVFQWDRRYGEAGTGPGRRLSDAAGFYVALAENRRRAADLEKYFVSRQLTP